MKDAGPLRVGLIGYGAIGRSVVRLVREREAERIAIVGALVREPALPRGPHAPPLVASVSELLTYRPEVVVEAAGHAALRAHGPAVLRAGVDLILVSAGALADPSCHDELLAAAREGRARARIASGAIAALDAIGAAAIGGLERLVHTARKPPRTLLPPDEAARLMSARELFRGSAREAAQRYPESLNVAAAVALAGCGMDRTEVRLVADPAVRENRHHIVADGAFGRLELEIRNEPSPDNPRTGRLVAMSIVHALKQRRAALVIG